MRTSMGSAGKSIFAYQMCYYRIRRLFYKISLRATYGDNQVNLLVAFSEYRRFVSAASSAGHLIIQVDSAAP